MKKRGEETKVKKRDIDCTLIRREEKRTRTRQEMPLILTEYILCFMFFAAPYSWLRETVESQ